MFRKFEPGLENAANDNTLTIISISCVKSMKMGALSDFTKELYEACHTVIG